jgi:transcriptional regulator with XRE-family HTH domain
MEERRQALGMTWAEVASEAKITVETLRAIRRGNNQPSTLTKRGLERALQWQTGSIQAVLAGGDPSPVGAMPSLTAEASGTVTRAPQEESDPLAAQFRALLEQAQQRTNERLAELAGEVEKVKEENQALRRLLDDRKGA